MAEDEDGASNRKSHLNSENADPLHENEQNPTKPDLGIEEANYNITENGLSPPEPRSSTSKSNGATRKDENPFSFRHFLKRDLSLPGNSTYESLGARPKVYANTVQHSPTRLDLHSETRRERDRPRDTLNFHTKDSDSPSLRLSEGPSSSSVEIPLSENESARLDSSRNFIEADSFYHRPNLATEPLGMPSLPDFVQDHILVEQAYLNSNGPISVDLDNLPDFTFNTNYNASSSGFPSGRRNNSEYDCHNRNYDYNADIGAASADFGVPLDLPAGAEAPGAGAEPPHLNLDLTESVNPADRRTMSPRNNFDNPLDLPPNAGAEPMALPDFLPVRAGAAAGRTSPEPEEAHHTHQIANELERVRSELVMERARRCRVEGELQSQRETASILRAEVASARASEAALRARLSHMDEGEGLDEAASVAPDSSAVAKLKKEIKQLKEQLNRSRSEARLLRQTQGVAASDLRQAASHAETELRSLLSGIEQLRVLSAALERDTT